MEEETVAASEGDSAKQPAGKGPQAKMALAIIIVAILVSASALAYLVLSKTGDDDSDGDGDGDGGPDESTILTVIGKDGTTVNYTLADLKAATAVSGASSVENKFGNAISNGTYTGVLVSDLIASVGGMGSGDIVRINATDPYSQDYSYCNVYPDEDWLSLQGELIIAYEMDSLEVPDWTDGPRSMFMTEDGLYSNQDCNWTTSPEHITTSTISGGSRWVKNAARVQVIDGPEDWSIALHGATEKSLSKTEFDIYKQWYETSYTDDDGDNWSGVPLWRLIGLVDGGDARGDDCFNASFEPQPDGFGYDLKVQEGDEYTKYLEGSLFEPGNDTLFLADAMNGTALDAEYAPLRLVAPGFRGSYWVSRITDISLTPSWPILLSGEENETLLYDEIVGMGNVTGIAYRYKVSYPDLPIEGPWNFTGIPLMDLVSRVFNTSLNFSVEVQADDYSVTLSKDEALGNVTVYDMDKSVVPTGSATPIIAFEEEGERWFNGGPLRLVFVNDTGAVTDAALANKYVNKIVVGEVIQEWELDIDMNMSSMQPGQYVCDREYFEHSAQPGKHYANVTYKDVVYEGIPLWILVGAVDGNDTSTHWGFNDTLAAGGYNVTIWGAEGYNNTFSSADIARNDSIIVAYMTGGGRLIEDEWPLRLVGDGWSGSLNVKAVWKIEVVD